MANAEKKTETKVVVTGVNLSLSVREAMVLASLLGYVGGDPSDTVRAETNSIFTALHEAGIPSNIDAFYDGTEARALSFEDVKRIAIVEGSIPLCEVDSEEIRGNVVAGNSIAAIKLLRELVPGTGLKEAKEEVDRRIAISGKSYQRW